MPTKTEEIIKEVSQELQVTQDQVLQQSLKAFLEHRLHTVEAEVFEIRGKYNISSVEAMESRYREGSLEEAGSWRDLQRLDHLEYQRDRLRELLRKLR